MRHFRRNHSATKPLRGMFLTALTTLIFLSACSFPSMDITRKEKAERDEAYLFSASAAPGKDKRYLATVHLRFSEAKDARAIIFDVRRDKRKMIVAKLWESEETTTMLHLGYTRSDGPIAGLRFNWRF